MSGSGNNVYQQAATGMQQAGNLTSMIANNGTAPGYGPARMNAAGYNPTLMGSSGYDPRFMNGSNAGAASLANGAGYNSAMQGAAGQLANTNLNPYLNPYTQNVINTTTADMNRSRQMVQAQNGAQASAAGAFGGARHGLVEAETNRGFADEIGQVSSQLRSAGYQNAQQSALADIANRMSVSGANQNATNQARQFTAGNQQQSNLFNAGAQNNMAQFNATNQQQARVNNQNAFNQAGQFNAANQQQSRTNNQNASNQAGQYNATNQQQSRVSNQNAKNQASQFNAGMQGDNRDRQLGAASQLANISNLGFGMGQQINGDLAGQGAQQQAMQQALIAAAQGQFGNMQGAGAQGLQQILAALSAGSGGAGQNSTTSQKPGLLQFLTPLLGAF